MMPSGAPSDVNGYVTIKSDHTAVDMRHLSLAACFRAMCGPMSGHTIVEGLSYSAAVDAGRWRASTRIEAECLLGGEGRVALSGQVKRDELEPHTSHLVETKW